MDSTKPTRVLHLAGSAVSDFYADVSRLYAADCLAAAIDPGRYEHHVAWVSPDGSWRFPADLSPASVAAAPAMQLPAAIAQLTSLDIDVAVPQMFCLPGMTHYRALLDLLGIAYVGNEPAVMALGADKARSSAVVAAHGVHVPASQVVRPGQSPELERAELERAELEPPIVVKPVDADNSVGLTLLRDAAELDQGWASAVRSAADHDSAGRALAQTYVELGREIRCGVVDLGGPDGLACLPLEEYAVDAAAKPIRDQADKLRRGDDGDLALVAKDTEHAWIVDPDDPVVAAVNRAALACYDALGCRHYGLFDFRVDPEGVPYFLEAGLYCSYAPSSVVATMAAAAGIELGALFDAGIERALSARSGLLRGS